MTANDRCRTIGHSWSFTNAGRVDGFNRLDLRCGACGTERSDKFGPSSGMLLGRNYKYPAGYCYKAGETPTRSEFRLALFAALTKRKDET